MCVLRSFTNSTHLFLKSMNKTSSKQAGPIPGHPNLKPHQLTPDELARGQAAFKWARELRHDVSKAYKSRSSYLRSLEISHGKPKAWIRAEWDNLYLAYFRKLDRENKANV